MRLGAPDDAQVEHAVPRQVVHVRAGAREQPTVFLPGGRGAYHGEESVHGRARSCAPRCADAASPMEADRRERAGEPRRGAGRVLVLPLHRLPGAPGGAGEGEIGGRRGLRAQMIETVRGWIDAAERVVALTGAGISTDSGIPDFRGPQGVWTRNPGAEKLATLQHYLADPDVRRRAWRSRLESPAWQAKPNAGHLALVTLERRGKVPPPITPKHAGLHPPAGAPPQPGVANHRA